MRMPGADKAEFLILQPMIRANRPNMIAWVAARNDPDDYGKTTVFRFPSETNVFGPAQIEAQIDIDPDISSQITLWNQSGSTVVRGNLIVLPVGDSLIYLQPVYLRSESAKFPAFERIVVASSSHVVWGATLSEALGKFLAEEASGGPLRRRRRTPRRLPRGRDRRRRPSRRRRPAAPPVPSARRCPGTSRRSSRMRTSTSRRPSRRSETATSRNTGRSSRTSGRRWRSSRRSRPARRLRAARRDASGLLTDLVTTRGSTLAALLAVVVRPTWWILGLAGFLARGGILLFVLATVTLPSPLALSNVVAPLLVPIVFGGMTPFLLAVIGLGILSVVAWIVVGAGSARRPRSS